MNVSRSLVQDPPVVAVIDEIAVRLRRFGVKFSRQSAPSLARFAAMPPRERSATEGALMGYLRSMDVVLPLASADKAEFERGMLRSFGDFHSLVIPEDFLRQIAADDVCEIYDVSNQMQTYRNFEFMRLCSYDLLTVVTTPLTQLFYREPKFNDRIRERSEEITFGAAGVLPWNVDAHMLVERLGREKNVFNVTMGHAAPVFCGVTGKPVAWVSSLRVKPLGPCADHPGLAVPL